MKTQSLTLPDLGWSQLYQMQLSIEDLETLTPVRVNEVHRRAVETLGADGALRVPMSGELFDHGVAVGDWILLENGTVSATKVLERKSLLKRRASGDHPSSQLIAANVDTLFIVSSCNADYNPARLERYLVLAHQAGIDPVLILTKSDLLEEPNEFGQRARVDLPGIHVELINAKSPDTIKQLEPWCGHGQTVALVGSSGVGKTTLTNLLTEANALTLSIREDDAKGRHTTTARSMYRIPTGGWLIDTPGMRALRLHDVSEGVEMVFQDVADLVAHCKFNDCEHETEPGCAIQAAIAAGELDASRLMRWQKLRREDERHTETLAVTHAKARRTDKKHKIGKLRGQDKQRHLDE